MIWTNRLLAVWLFLSLVAAPANCDGKHRASSLKRQLLQAVEDRDWTTARRVLDRGANANVRDKDGTPVLVVAALGGHAGTVARLLDTGARVNDRGVGGETALMVAAAKAHPDTVRVLIQRGAKVNLRSANGATALSLCRAKNKFPSGSKPWDEAITRTIKLLKQAGANG